MIPWHKNFGYFEIYPKKKEKSPPDQKWSLVKLGPCDWLMGGIFSIVLKWHITRKYDSDHQISMLNLPLGNRWFFLSNAYIQWSQAYFIKYIRSKHTLSIPFACDILIFFGMASLTVFSARNLVWQPLSVVGFKPDSHIRLFWPASICWLSTWDGRR